MSNLLSSQSALKFIRAYRGANWFPNEKNTWLPHSKRVSQSRGQH